MQFVFLQPELRSKTNSHFYLYLLAIEESLAVKGHNIQTVASEVFDNSKKTEKLLSFKNTQNRFSNPVAVLWRILSRNLMAYFEFKKIINQLAGQNQETVFFVDTILNERIIGLALAFKKTARLHPSIKLAILFRFTYRSNSEVLTRLQQYLHKLFCYIQHTLIRQKRCILFTDSTRLQTIYQQNLQEQIQVMPIPLRPSIYEQMDMHKLQKSKIISIGFMGGKISYKGLNIFLHILVVFISLELRFLVHGVRDHEDLFDFAKQVLNPEEIILLQKNKHKIFTFSQLNEIEYLALFDQMDVILIPYTSLQFAEGTSNIFAESVSAGVIPVVPSDTWMADELVRAQMGELVVDFNDFSKTAATVSRLLKNSYQVKQKMHIMSTNWRAYHSSDIFADSLIQSVRS